MPSMRFLSLLFPSLLLLSLPSFSHTGGPGTGNPGEDPENKREPSNAIVVYNADATFYPSASYSVEYYSHMIDSLVRLDNIPVTLVNQLNVYRNLSKLKRSELLMVVDSIFECPNIPRTVVNAINIYLAAVEEERAAPRGIYAYVPLSTRPYPADAFYGDWNNVEIHPKRSSHSALDSALTLLLVDEELDCGFELPFEGKVTSHFGWRWGRSHNGTDIDLEVWDPVKAAFAGTVRVARMHKGYGRVVVIRHHNGLETLYAHLHRFKVTAGDEVEAGDIIGLGGSSGNSTGSHLHFEARFLGMPVNPASFINFRTGKLKSETITLKKSGSALAVVNQPLHHSKPAPVTASKVSITAHKIYEVKKGDYLYKIAREQGVAVEDICASNQLQANAPLRVGQKLKLEASHQ